MTASISMSRTGISYIDGLLSGSKWAVSSLTYSFPTSSGMYGSNYSSYAEPDFGFASFNQAEQAAVRDIYAKISAVVPLAFTEISETTTQHADLRFGYTSVSPAPGGAWARYPGSLESAGDVWVQPGMLFDTPLVGNQHYQVLMHEILHSLGMKHPFESMGLFPAADQKFSLLDFTNEAYFGFGNGPWSAPQGLQRGDIAALQTMYGANFETYSGHTTYTVRNDGTVGVADWRPDEAQTIVSTLGSSEKPLYLTIWDGGGGMDSYHFDQLRGDLRVDLRPGQGSVVLEDKQISSGTNKTFANLYNAFQYNDDPRSLIEGATTGTGNDIIVGNKANNTILDIGGHDIFVVDAPLALSSIGIIKLSYNDGMKSFNPGNQTTAIVDPEGDIYDVQIDVNGAQGRDYLRGIDEVWFNDKKVLVDWTSERVVVTFKDFNMGSTFEGDWWSNKPGTPWQPPAEWMV